MTLPIASPPWDKLGKKIESLIRKACYDFDFLHKETHVALALSGGKDSLTLLFFLHAMKNRGLANFELTAIHVSGEYSCGAGVNQQYLRAICHELGVPFIVKESFQTLEKLECYSCSRERRKLLFDAAKEAGSTTIAFGHHRDDHVQTLLLNLFHKGEFCGNLAKVNMERYGITIIRPLFYASEELIKDFSKLHGYCRITCQCPVGQDSYRKKVDSLINEIQEVFPNIRSNLAHAGLEYGSDKASRP
jgi:tRNA 2-thiocytidine biosynthesis protein TtcA